MQECRCRKCNKLLAKIEGKAEIICTRCNVFNEFNVPEQLTDQMGTKWYGDQWKEIRQKYKV